jgi:hypothetical protein
MAEQWIIRVQGKDYGPADLDTLREWKADGRVVPENPARRTDDDLAAVGSAKEAQWQTAGEIPGLFQIEPPPVQQIEDGGQRTEARSRRSEVGDQQSKAPSRNLLTETFRIYFRGFFQFLTLTLLIALPSLCGRLFGMMMDGRGNLSPDLRTNVVQAFTLCMFVLTLVLWPIYVAGIQILTVELSSGEPIGFFSALNHAVKYWPRVAGLSLFVYLVFFLLTAFWMSVVLMVYAAGIAASVFLTVVALSLAVLQIWLFCRFFAFVLFWQQFAVLENLPAYEALRQSNRLAHSGRDLAWYQRPLWRGALIVSVWTAFVLAIGTLVLWPKIMAEYPLIRDFVNQLPGAQDPQALIQKTVDSLPKEQPATLSEIGLGVLQRILQPLLGIAFVVLYLDSKPDAE